MRLFNAFVIHALLVLVFKCCSSEEGKIELTLQVNDSINKLPLAEDEWFAVNFICTINNNTNRTIYFVDPEAYNIFPQPWIIAINDVDANFWPGSYGCAPSFEEENIIKLEPMEKIEKRFDWHYFVENFSDTPGDYTAKIRYFFIKDSTWTEGAEMKNLSDLEIGYSNSVKFKIVNSLR